jgi:hypothetical protein
VAGRTASSPRRRTGAVAAGRTAARPKPAGHGPAGRAPGAHRRAAGRRRVGRTGVDRTGPARRKRAPPAAAGCTPADRPLGAPAEEAAPMRPHRTKQAQPRRGAAVVATSPIRASPPGPVRVAATVLPHVDAIGILEAVVPPPEPERPACMRPEPGDSRAASVDRARKYRRPGRKVPSRGHESTVDRAESTVDRARRYGATPAQGVRPESTTRGIAPQSESQSPRRPAGDSRGR